MIRAAVIGYGYWGPNIVRNFTSCGAIDLTYVCDADPARLARARETHPGVRTTTRLADVLGDASIDAVAVITPVASHFELAMAALRAGKSVWIEKPVTACAEEASRLCDEADRRGRVLFVDHTFVYTAAVRKLRELVFSGALGDLCCYDSVRANLGLYRPDVDVLWDLAVHDVSILDYALQGRIVAVSATGVAGVPGMPASSAFMTAFLEGGAVMHVHADWFAPEKVRKTTITGDRRMIVYDDNEPTDKLRVWDRGVDVAPRSNGGPPDIAYRNGPAETPAVEKTEALSVAARHFAECVASGKKPITDGEFGFRVVRVLEAASRSLAARGQPVEV